MNLHKPIPVLESFKRTKLAQSMKNSERIQTNYGPSAFFELPVIALGMSGVLFLHGAWLVLWGIVWLLLFFVVLFLALSVKEMRSGEDARRRLTHDDMEKARELIKKHGK